MSPPDKQALVVHTFLAAESPTTPEARSILSAAATQLGINQPVDIGASGSVLEVRRRAEGSGFYEIVTAAVAEVIVVSVLLAPNDRRHDWRRLWQEWDDALRCAPPALGSASIQLGLGAGRTGGRSRWMAQSNSYRTGDVRLWDSPVADDKRRRLIVLAPAAAERTLDRWVWYGNDRAVPPLTRYLLHAEVLRHQNGVLQEALPRLRTARTRAADQCATLARMLHAERPSITDLGDAGRALVTVRTEQGGLLAAETTADDMAQTVRAATRNMSAALGTTLTTDREIGGWLSDQLDTELTYLRSVRRQADELTRLCSAVIDQRQQKRQQLLSLMQASVLGSLLMALAAIQSLQYRVPVPGPLMAPLIVLLATVALLLPPTLLTWPDRTNADRPAGGWYVAGAALLGAASGWLACGLGWQAAMHRPAPPAWSVLIAVGGAGVAAAVGWAGVRWWEKAR